MPSRAACFAKYATCSAVEFVSPTKFTAAFLEIDLTAAGKIPCRAVTSINRSSLKRNRSK